MNKEEICKIIDDKLESKIKDLKNINPPYRKVEVILKNYKNFQKMQLTPFINRYISTRYKERSKACLMILSNGLCGR